MMRDIRRSARLATLPLYLDKLDRHETIITWLAAAGLLAFSVVALLDRHVFGDTSPLFWDLVVYGEAVDLLASDLNPYNSQLLHNGGVANYLHYTSPPAITWLFAAIAHSPFRALFKPALILLHFIAIIGTPIVMGRLFFGHSPARLALAAGAFLTLFAISGIGAFSAMNNGTVLNFLIVAMSPRGFVRREWSAFHVAVTLAAVFKPYYLFFWIIPVMAHGFSWRQAAIAALCGTAAALTYLLPLWMDPELFRAWVNNLVQQMLVLGDAGANVFGAVKLLTGQADHWLPYAAQIIFIAFLAGLLLATPLKRLELWAALFIGAIFMNPRILGYDIAIASIPFAFAFATLLPASISKGFRLILSTYLLAGSMLVLSYNSRVIPQAVLFPLSVAALLLVMSLRAGHGRNPWMPGRVFRPKAS